MLTHCDLSTSTIVIRIVWRVLRDTSMTRYTHAKKLKGRPHPRVWCHSVVSSTTRLVKDDLTPESGVTLSCPLLLDSDKTTSLTCGFFSGSSLLLVSRWSSSRQSIDAVDSRSTNLPTYRSTVLCRPIDSSTTLTILKQIVVT